VEALAKKGAVIICGLKLKDYMHTLGVREVYELDWWESVTVDNVTYTFLPAQHWSLRFGQWSAATLWGSFLITHTAPEGKTTTIYFSGDTGYFRGFEEFGRLYDIDYALLGLGAYEPRWFMHYVHMNTAEFLMSAKELKAKTVIPMHLGTIKLGMEPVYYGYYELEQKMNDKPALENTIKMLRVGQRLIF
jgi:L-ascorbate metabolism protein UlaG (beta-lactamase superfamily)